MEDEGRCRRECGGRCGRRKTSGGGKEENLINLTLINPVFIFQLPITIPRPCKSQRDTKITMYSSTVYLYRRTLTVALILHDNKIRYRIKRKRTKTV